MRVHCIGGGPGGLYAAILLKKALPEASVRVFERNRHDDTFGWGVVFSDETLDGFRDADPESYQAISDAFVHWTDIDIHFGDACVTSTGHGFSGLSRRRLLLILQERCRALGVELEFEREVSPDDLSDADLVIAADGVNSRVREALAEHLEPSVEWGRCRFAWLGTTLPLNAFTFVFVENEHGLFQAHAYPFEDGTSTFIVECHEDVWKRAGLDDASEADTVAYCEALFAPWLDGHPLLTNRSLWRSFPTVSCERWHHGEVVLLGDAAHTAHFSIGSGTKLAMEDAVALAAAFQRLGTDDIPATLAAYQELREVDVLKTQKAALTSREWFEHSARYRMQPPLQRAFNLLTRSKQITWDNLELRDPRLIDRVRRWFAADQEVSPASDGRLPPPMFAPYRIGRLDVKNRVVVSPMCQYRAEDGVVGDWHLAHYGSRAIGGAGLVITEMTDVSPEGRITHGCAGLWDDRHVEAWRRITGFVHRESDARIGVQLAHAGRKASCARPWEGGAPLTDGGWTVIGPSAHPFDARSPVPRAMDRGEMDRVVRSFEQATARAYSAGFDLVELHLAHGYLLSSFLSPLSNRRTDDYGGSLENRMRFPLEVLSAVRAAWPRDKPVLVRISASDWHPDGQTLDESVELARALFAAGCDLIDVSSAGNSPESDIVYGRMYQVPFAERIRHELGVPVMAVGAILGADHVNTILAAGRADLCALARPHLRDPYLTLHAAQEHEYPDVRWPVSYLLGKDLPASERHRDIARWEVSDEDPSQSDT